MQEVTTTQIILTLNGQTTAPITLTGNPTTDAAAVKAALTSNAMSLVGAAGNISVTAVLVTNVFERRGTRWRMVLHHASHILTGESEPSA